MARSARRYAGWHEINAIIVAGDLFMTAIAAVRKRATWAIPGLAIFLFGCATPVQELWPPPEGAPTHTIVVSLDTWHAMIAITLDERVTALDRKSVFEEWGYAEQAWYLEGRQGITGALRALFWASPGVVEVGLHEQIWAARTPQPPSETFVFRLSETGYVRLRRHAADKDTGRLIFYEERHPGSERGATAPQPSVVPTNSGPGVDALRVRGDVSPRLCKLQEGQRGMCFVRACENGQVVLTTYGRSSGFCVDPIEKKPLNHYLPGTPILSFGTAGCNLSCKFCQNWDISKSREVDTLADAASPETIARAAQQLGCRSVAFTYNDPVIFMEYAIDVAQACHELGIKAVSVTAGFMCDEPRRELYKYMDAANVDLKAFTEQFYKQITIGHLQPVLDTLTYLKHETSVWFEITTLLIPGENDSEKEIEELTQWVMEHLGPDVPLHFTAFHPDFKMLDKPPTPPATLTMARRIAVKNGLRYAYTGNVHDEEGGSTYCHQCGSKLIGRDWYVMTAWNLTDDGRCKSCGTACAGVFDGPPGRWGAKRMPVRLKDFR